MRKALPADAYPRAELCALNARRLGSNGSAELSNSVAVSGTTENRGRRRPVRDKNVPPSNFSRFARMAWPIKPAATIAAIAGVDERTGKRYLAGESDPPIAVVIACLEWIFPARKSRDLA